MLWLAFIQIKPLSLIIVTQRFAVFKPPHGNLFLGPASLGCRHVPKRVNLPFSKSPDPRRVVFKPGPERIGFGLIGVCSGYV